MRSYTVLVFIFLAYLTLYNGFQFHPSSSVLFTISKSSFLLEKIGSQIAAE